MASIEVHTLANTIALPYTPDAAAPLYVPSNIGKTRAAELLAVRVLAWLIKHEGLAVTRNTELTAIDRVRGYAEAFVTERNWAPSRRPSVRTLDAGAMAAVGAYLGADDAERAEVLDALHTVPSAGGDDGYSVSMALADPSCTLANHLENIRDAVADALADIAKGRDAAYARELLAGYAASLATWRDAFLAGTDGVDVDAEEKDQRRMRLALAELALALGVDRQALGKYVGSFWKTDGAALYDAITDAIRAHAEGRGTGKGACRVCECTGTVVDGRCADCERKGAERPASVDIRGSVEYTPGVCRSCGADAETDTDYCTSCLHGQHVNMLFWRLFNCADAADRAAAKAKLIELGEYETDADAPIEPNTGEVGAVTVRAVADTAIRCVVRAERRRDRTWRQDYSTVGACTDCYFAIVNGDEPTHMTDDELAEWRANFDRFYASTPRVENVTPGHFHTEGDCGHVADACPDDCDCERTDFSHAPCGVCDSHLAGTRNDVTAWLI